MTDTPKPPNSPLAGCLIVLVVMAAIFGTCWSCLGGERTAHVYINNDGPAVGLRLMYEHQRDGATIARGVFMNSTRFGQGDFHAFELPVADVQPGDTLIISGSRLLMGAWADVPPITVPADGDVQLTYGPDTVTGRVGLRSP